MAAKNWYGHKKRINAKKAKASMMQQPSIRTKHVYHGPVNTGSLYNSNISLNQTPNNPQSSTSPPKGVGAGGYTRATSFRESRQGDAQVDRHNTLAAELYENDEAKNETEDEAEVEAEIEAGVEDEDEDKAEDEPEDEDEDEDEGEDDETSQLQKACDDLRQVHKQMLNKLPFPSGQFLEDSMYEYAMTLNKLDPVHFCILDSKMLSTLEASEKQRVLSRVLPLPAFPGELDECLSRYDFVTTTAECRSIARNSHDDKDVHWIDDVIRHVVELITDSGSILSHASVKEGVWDCLVYAPFWDKYFANIPGMILQRKEIILLASQYEPYLYLNYEARYDGVVQTRTSHRERSNRYELCVFETSSKFEGIDSKKWIKDRTKLLAGCRAMLYRLQAIVEYDADIMTRLQVVGVLQAGRYTQIYIMSCINRNVFYLRQGGLRELPTTLDELHLAYDIITNAWKVKRIIMDTAAALKKYFEEKGVEKGQSRKRRRTDPDFL